MTTDANTGGSFNRYAYAGNNPYKYIDPDGRAFCGSYQCESVGEGSLQGLRGIGTSIKNGFQQTVVPAIEGAVDTAKEWTHERMEDYRDAQQARADLISAAAHGDAGAKDQLGMEFAMGFVGSTSMKIAGGHAFEKHVLGSGAHAADGLFRGLGIRTVAQMEAHISSVMANPTAQKTLSGGRMAYWDASTSTVVIHNPRSRDLGTAFQPKDGIGYYNSLK